MMATNAELMRALIDEMYGEPAVKPTVTPAGTVGKGINLLESNIKEAPRGGRWQVLYSFRDKDGNRASCKVKLNAPSIEHAKRYATSDGEKKGRQEIIITRATQL